MQFAEIVGQKKIKRQLAAMADEGRVSHAILFCEEPGYGALPLAIAFAQYMSCPSKEGGDSCGTCPTCNKFRKLIHPDLHFAMPVSSTKTITADKKPVSDLFASEWREIIDQNCYLTEQEWYEHIEIENKSGIIGVNEAALISRKLSLRSFEGGKKFLIMWLPERMNQEAANKLLKLLEEPPPETYIFLVSEAPERVISTIVSRCQIFKLTPAETEELAAELTEEYDITPDEARFWAAISGGSLSRSRALINESGKESEFYQPLAVLLEGCATRDLKKIVQFWEEISILGREKQRTFCEYALEFLRRALITQAGTPEVSNTPPAQREFIRYWAGRLKPAFLVKGYDVLNNALADIDRNVNSKYIFADLGNRFFLSL